MNDEAEANISSLIRAESTSKFVAHQSGIKLR
jgi:hypothetical protein